MSKRVTILTDITMASGVSAANGDPFVHLTATDEKGNEMIGQATPTEMREHAMRYLEAAEAAETDAILFEWGKKEVGLDDQQLAAMLTVFRERRSQ